MEELSFKLKVHGTTADGDLLVSNQDVKEAMNKWAAEYEREIAKLNLKLANARELLGDSRELEISCFPEGAYWEARRDAMLEDL